MVWKHSHILSFIIAATTTKDENVVLSSFTIMNLLAHSSGIASSIGTVVTGVLLSILTKWGLFKYKWIIAKEILTLLSFDYITIYEYNLIYSENFRNAIYTKY
jgi:hypothetical protein